ncbi:serine/threonine-protein kinase [Nannocystis pusilla]|uniref:Serine/threonine-protein kinase n=1 Tax=Nannocystis pusilla TaxID=889268 RepID=A0A9X3EI88_9BACT|nr:serine/threonine-protein kinase [Nannocystis pusilla]
MSAGDPASPGPTGGAPLIALLGAAPGAMQAGDDPLAMALMHARLFGPQAGSLQVGRFTVLERLGEGGMGVVYAAYDALLDRKVALKLLHPRGLTGGGDARLLREAQAMARLSHPNIVSVFEVGSHGPQRFIAMEFVRGHSLDAWLKAAPRDWRAVLPILVAAGRGLEAAHRAGLVHRDYKPHNTLVGVDGAVKVADFGLARTHVAAEPPPAGDDPADEAPLLDRPLTRAGAVAGTPAYMAPEQHEGRPCDPRSDQFSFCVTAYQALYGALPFPTDSLAALLTAVRAGQVLPAPPDSPVPSWVRRAIVRGLAPDPAQRHPSMGALLAALLADPAVTRRRRARIGLFGAALGLLGALAGALATSPGARCPDGAAKLRGVWDDGRRAAIAAALLGSRQPFAASTWERVGRDLDRYAAAWRAALTDACEAHRAGRQSDTQYDLRVRCLELRRTALAELTGVLAQADPAALPRAALAAGSLPPIEACGDLEGLLADPLRPPADPARASAVGRTQVGLAHVRALESTGLYARAVAAADAVAADVAATGHRPFAAELALLRGRALLSERAEAADAALTAAVREGLAGGHDRAAIEALARRIFVRGYRLGRRDDALRDEEFVLALLDRVADDGRLRGEYLNNMGAVWLGLGEWTRAEPLLVAAVAAKTAAFGPDSGELVYTLANLGTLRNDLGRTGAAIEALGDAGELAERAFGATHPLALLVRANLGMVRLKHGRLRDAAVALEAARQGATSRPDPDHATLAFVERQLGWLALERRRPDDAEAHLAAADLHLQALGGDAWAAADVEVLRAHLAALRGARDAALDHHARARERLRGTPPGHPRWRELEGDLADLEASFGRHAEVLALADATARALDLDGPRPRLQLARAREHEALAYQGLGRFDEAARAAAAALALLEEVVAEDNPRLAAVLVRLGVSEAAAGRRDAGLGRLARAEQILVREADPDLPALALLRFERARLLAEPDAAAAEARAALDVLRAAGDGFRRERAAVEAWLARPRMGG